MVTTMTKRELAHELLGELFAGRKRIAITEVVDRGRELDVSRRTLRRAATELGIHEIHNGPHPGFWEMP
jgi:hypothetical protein